MKPIHYLAALCCLLLQFHAARSYDQLSYTQWRQEFVGHVTWAEFHATKARLFVSTEQHVVAALHPRDGAVIWRQTLDSEILATSLSKSGRIVATVTDGGKQLLAWSAIDGALLWSTVLRQNTACGKEQHAVSVAWATGGSSKSDMLVASVGTNIQAYHATTGSLLWQQDLPNEWDCALVQIHVQQTDAEVRVLAWQPGQHSMLSASLNPATGEIEHSHILSSDGALGDQLVASQHGAAILLKDNSAVCTVTNQQQSTMSCYPLHDLAAKPDESCQLHAGTSEAAVAVGCRSSGVWFVEQGEDGGVKTISSVARLFDALAFSTDADGAGSLAVVRNHAEGLQVVIHSMHSGAVVHEETVELTSDNQLHGFQPRLAVLSAAKRKDGTMAFRTAVLAVDHTLCMLHQSSVVWTRHEALADIQDAVFVDLPAELSSSVSVPRMPVMTWVKQQIFTLKKLLQAASPEELQLLDELQEQYSDRNLAVRDQRGLRKMIVALTRSGTVYALHTGDGRVLWSRALFGAARPNRLILWRTTHALHAAPLLAAYTQCSTAQPSKRSQVFVFDAYTGDTFGETIELPECVGELQKLPQSVKVDGDIEQHMYLASTTAADHVMLLPDTPDSRSAFDRMHHHINLWSVDRDRNLAHGCSFAGPLQRDDAGRYGCATSWVISLPGSVLAVAEHDPSEVEHSYVKILGSGELKFKYLNANTAFIAVGVQDGVVPDDMDESSIALTAMVIDTVTGRVLHRQVHQGARGPVHAVFTEHLVAYHYWSVANHRWEMTAMELYVPGKGSPSLGDAFFGSSIQHNFTSFEAFKLEVMMQSYYTRAAVKMLKATQTARGITNRFVLIGTALDQIYGMDARFLNPRRPKVAKLTMEQQMEGLIPYMPHLMLAPLQYITTDKQVVALRNIFTAPATVESTCHVFATGVDLFYTRVAPSRLFDGISDDFPYVPLIATVAVLVVATAVMQVLAGHSSLKQKWV